jgi:hypothetical protein
VKRDSRPHQASERQQERNQNSKHRERSLSVGAGNFNRGNAYGVFSRDNAGYLAEKAEYDEVECQFGGSTVNPEDRLIARSDKYDLATFDVPEVFVSASFRNIYHHNALRWPPNPIQAREVGRVCAPATEYAGFELRDREPRVEWSRRHLVAICSSLF